MLSFIVVLAQPCMWIFKRSTNWTIYLLHNHLDIYLIIPWKRKTSLVLSNLKWFEKSKSRHWGKNWIKKNLRQPNNSVLCLKLKWPQHQRHLLLKRRTKSLNDTFRYRLQFDCVNDAWISHILCVKDSHSNQSYLSTFFQQENHPLHFPFWIFVSHFSKCVVCKKILWGIILRIATLDFL